MYRYRMICIVVAIFAAGASAEVYVVEPDGSGDFPTIQAAMSAISDGDIIELTDGVFVGAGNRGIDFQGKSVTVRSISGDPHACIIDCEAANRAFIFETGEGPESVLEGIGITNGKLRSDGGAILCSLADPTISNCFFSNNCCWGIELGHNGGAIFCGQSFATITDCEFRENEAGTGIFNDGGHGGAICIGGGAPTLRRCHFVDNVAEWLGGGAYVEDSNPLIVDCTFTGNVCGVLAFWQGDGQVVNCTFTANLGGILCWGGSSPTFSNCIFIRNESSIGSAFDCYIDSSPTLVNCTLYANRAWSAGAGLNCEESSFPTLINTIIAFSTEGEAIWCDESSGAYLSCCDLYGNAGGDWTGCIEGQLGVDGNISLDPLFCDAPNDDLTLAANSPCAPAYSPPGCELIGALPVGCGASDVEYDSPGVGSDGILLVTTGAQPATTSTFLQLTAMRSGRVRACVYDLRGACVRTLLDDDLPAGRTRVFWDLRDDAGRPVSPGVYFVNCTLGSTRVHGRVIVTR